MRILDISPTLSGRIAVWPGDTRYRRRVNLSLAEGANIELSDIHTTVHVGAHADAPSHYVLGGQTIDQRPLERYFGPCQVVDVAVGRGERVQPRHIEGPIVAPRLLLRTGTFPDAERFNEDFAALSPALIEDLARRGVSLVGLDTPSVDLFADAALLSHQAVARHDLAVLEGLVLDGIEPGVYTLCALPLKLEGADASPVRAVLVDGA